MGSVLPTVKLLLAFLIRPPLRYGARRHRLTLAREFFNEEQREILFL